MGPAIRAEPWRNDQNASAFSQLRQWSLGRWLVAPWVRVSRCASYLVKKGISIAGIFAHRRSLNARLYCFRRKNLIDSAAHDLVALACRCFEPRSVNLDQTPPISTDSTRHPELAHNMRHSRSSYSKQLRKRLLRQRQEVAANSIVDVEQPPGQAGLDRVQRIAGRHMLDLRQQRPTVCPFGMSIMNAIVPLRGK